MKRFLAPALAGVFLTTVAPAQDATLSVLHGIPGLPAPVEVFANGNALFTFDYAEIRGPLPLPAGTYALEVRLQGTPVLNANATLQPGRSYNVVAHLRAGGGNQLSLFENDLSPLAHGDSRLLVRHLADAPAVDVIARRIFGSPQVLFGNVGNPMEGSAVVRSSLYFVSLNAAGQSATAFGPEAFFLRSGKVYAVHAIGRLGDPSFRLFAQVLDAGPATGLTGTIQGTSCGGAIGLSTTSPAFGQAFDVTLTGATPDAFGILHAGTSDSRFLFFRLPLDLGLLGARNCSLYQSTEILMPLRTDANGDASRSITIPTGAAAWFRQIHFQYSFVNGGTNALGLSLSDYATVRSN